MDLNALRLEVFRQTGFSIEQDDPFFAGIVMLSLIADDIAQSNLAALAKMEAVATDYSKRNGTYQEKYAANLEAAVASIQQAAAKLTGLEDGMQRAAASSARVLLLGDDRTVGPVPVLKALVREQHEALGWLNRAAERYSNVYWLTGSVGLVAGLIGGLIVRFL